MTFTFEMLFFLRLEDTDFDMCTLVKDPSLPVKVEAAFFLFLVKSPMCVC